MTTEKPVKMINRVSYALGDLYGGGGFFLVSTLAMYFLVNVVGLTAWYAGLVFGISRIVDAIADPLMGYISDRTKSRLGRRRIFFALGILPIFISFVLVWYPVTFSDQFLKFLYYLLSYIFFYLTSTMVLIPYYALNAEMTMNYSERNKLSSIRLMFSMGSTLVVALAADPFIKLFQDPAMGHRMLGVAAGVFCAIPWIFVILGTWELPVSHDESEYKNFMVNFFSIFKNRSFQIHILMFLCAYGCMEVLKSWFKFYAVDYLGRPGFFSLGLGIIILTELLSVIFYTWVANKKGKGVAYLIGMSLLIVAMALFSLHDASTPFYILVVNCIFIGFGLAAGVFIPWAILPFVTDVDELITSKKRAGTYSGGMTLVRKLMQGVVVAFLGFLLNAIGYVPMAETQSVETLSKLKILFIITPIVFSVLGIIFASRFRITPETHRILMAEIDRLKTGGSKMAVAPEVKMVCEELTGIKYEELYSQK